MSHNKFDRKMKDTFDKMDDHDMEQAMHGKEKIWNSLDVNQRKKADWRSGIIWFFLGLLLALAGLYIKHLTLDAPKKVKNPIAEINVAKDWEEQLERLENKIAEMESKYTEKSALFEALTLDNKKLKAELLTTTSMENVTQTANEKVIYVQDTIYVTKVEKETVELEKILRDTVFIEVPIVIQEDEDLMTDISNNPDIKKENDHRKSNNTLVKSKPTSVQFNFRKENSKNK